MKNAAVSTSGPPGVPVPWHSMQSTSVGVNLHSLSTALMHFSCAGPLGAVSDALRPSSAVRAEA